jgi:hypothetical protein
MPYSTALTIAVLLTCSATAFRTSPGTLGELIPIEAQDFLGLPSVPLRGLTAARLWAHVRQTQALNERVNEFFAPDSSSHVGFYERVDGGGLRGFTNSSTALDPTAKLSEIWITEVSLARAKPRDLTERALAAARQRAERCDTAAVQVPSMSDPSATETTCTLTSGITLFFELRPACRQGKLGDGCLAARTRIVVGDDPRRPD